MKPREERKYLLEVARKLCKNVLVIQRKDRKKRMCLKISLFHILRRSFKCVFKVLRQSETVF
jgi:hypothetical protein